MYSLQAQMMGVKYNQMKSNSEDEQIFQFEGIWETEVLNCQSEVIFLSFLQLSIKYFSVHDFQKV